MTRQVVWLRIAFNRQFSPHPSCLRFLQSVTSYANNLQILPKQEVEPVCLLVIVALNLGPLFRYSKHHPRFTLQSLDYLTTQNWFIPHTFNGFHLLIDLPGISLVINLLLFGLQQRGFRLIWVSIISIKLDTP